MKRLARTHSREEAEQDSDSGCGTQSSLYIADTCYLLSLNVEDLLLLFTTTAKRLCIINLHLIVALCLLGAKCVPLNCHGNLTGF